MILEIIDRGEENPIDILGWGCLWVEGPYI